MSDPLTLIPLAGGPSRILAVDDEMYVRDLVCRWLKSAGHDCVAAESVEAAWDYLARNPVDLIVSDINMPGRSGLELLHDVRETYPDTAMMMMTAMGEAKTAVEALTHGAWGYLIKPVEREELIFQVAGMLERRQLRLEQRDYTRNLEEKVRQQTAEIRKAHEETIYRLVAASLCRDEETGMHIKRTGLLSEALARAAGWSATEAEIIRMAAPMHDVGKIGIPDAILRKPGKLTPEEFETMKNHTIIGAKMLDGSQSAMLSMARDIALNHHERWDGSGYPQGIAGTAIPEAARIVSVVDVYDALGHDRVYHKAMREDEVLSVIQKGAGSHFDPTLAAIFLANFETMGRIAEANPDEAAANSDTWAFLSTAPIVAPISPATSDASVIVTSAHAR